MKKRTRAELEVDLAKAERHNTAFTEWWVCESKNVTGRVFYVTAEDGMSLSVCVRGIARAAGGVAVVSTGDYRDMPRLLDDVLTEWTKDGTPKVKDAAERMRAWRDAELKGMGLGTP